MSYPYPRERRKLFCINGIFDDFSNEALSLARWFPSWVPDELPDPPYPTNLEFHGKLDTGTGTQFIDSSPKARVITEVSIDGSEWDSTSYRTRANYCVHFDGAADYFRMMAMDGEGMETHGWTFAAWAKNDNASVTSDGDGIFAVYDNSAKKYAIALEQETDDTITCTIINTAGTVFTWKTAADPVVFTDWHFYVITWDGVAANDPILYIDGQVVAWNVTGSPVTGTVCDIDFLYYAFGNGGASYWDGRLDDCLCFSVVLTAAQVELIFDSMPEFERVVWGIVPAPGGAGGNALLLHGNLDKWGAPAILMKGQAGLSPYPHKSNLYFFSMLAPFYWKMRAEFRLYIETDTDGSGTLRTLAHCAGFYIDGNVLWDAAENTNAFRTGVYFNVAEQKAGVASSGNPWTVDTPITQVAWAGAYETWYDVRIEWEYNWFVDNWSQAAITTQAKNSITITVYVNNSQLFTHTYELQRHRVDWYGSGIYAQQEPIGRLGPVINVSNDTVEDAGTPVTAYFKDIWVTQDVSVAQWKYNNSIIAKGTDHRMMGRLVASEAIEVGRGSDIQFYARKTLTDDWVGHYRGIIRDIERVTKRLLNFEAEGYSGFLSEEKSENLSFTTETAATIVAAAIHNPTKYEFDTTTFFDSPSATYTRDYPHVPKVDIMKEMSARESYVLFVDIGNCWHFQKIRTNQSDIHLIYGQTNVIDHEYSNVFAREPNYLRVVGSGVFAEREISGDRFESHSAVVRTVNKLDLTTQAEVDEALDYYTAIFIEPIHVLTIKLRGNWNLRLGYTITVTDQNADIYRQQFLIIEIKANQLEYMELTLIQVKPGTDFLLSDMYKRQEELEDQSFPSDLVAAADNWYIEGKVTSFISAFFEIYRCPDPGTCGASDVTNYELIARQSCTITDDLIDWLIDLWNGDNPAPYLTHIGLGTDNTPGLFEDTTLKAEGGVRTTFSMSGKGDEVTTGTGIGTEYYGLHVVSNKYVGVTNLAEVGLFSAAAAGTMWCRGVLDTKITTSNDVMVRFVIRMKPQLGPNLMTGFGIDTTMGRLLTGGAIATPSFMVAATKTCFSIPTPAIGSGHSEFGASIGINPRSNLGTFTKTKLKDQDMLKFQFNNYTWDSTDCWPPIPAGYDYWISHIGTPAATDQYDDFPFIMFYRTGDISSDFDGKVVDWIMWIHFRRGDYAIKDNKVNDYVMDPSDWS